MVKDPTRAADKVAACYGGDISALLDVCRCRLVFDSVEDLAACVALAARSADVRVVRARSTLRRGSAAGRGGFRAVTLHVRLVATVARELCLDQHICEVQLLLHTTADVLRAADQVCYRELRALWALGGEAEARQLEPCADREPCFVAVAPLPQGSAHTFSGSSTETAEVTHPPAMMAHDFPVASTDTLKAMQAPAALQAEDDPAPGPIPSALDPPHCRRTRPNVLRAGSISKRKLAWSADRDSPIMQSMDSVREDTINETGPTETGGSALRFWLSGLVVPEDGGHETEQTVANLALREETLMAARRVFLKFALGYGADLDKQASNFEQALHASESYSALFSSKPFAAYAAKRVGRIRTLLMFLCWTALCAYYSQLDLQNGRGRLFHPWLRILPAQAAQPKSQVNLSSVSPTFTQLGLLQDGCNASVAMFTAGEAPVMSGNNAAANGYYFVTNGSSPASWALEASDDSKTWQPVSPCSWVTVQVSKDGGQSWLSSAEGLSSSFVDCVNGQVSMGLVDEAEQKDLQVRVDFRPDVPAVSITMGFFVVPVGWLCSLYAALKGWYASFKFCLVIPIACFGVWAVSWSLVASSYGSSWQRVAYLLLIWCSVPCCFSAISIVYLERYLVFIFCLNGILFLVQFYLICVLLDAKILDFLVLDVHTWMMITLGGYLFIGSILFYYLRRRAIKKAQSLLSGDQQKYEETWKDVVQNERIYIEHLKQKIEEIRCQKTVLPARQMIQVADSGILSRRLKFRWCPMRSLDQLYVQAICLEPILLRKVKDWAVGCSGCFACASAAGLREYVQYSEIEKNKTFNVKWCRLKTEGRAIEKSIRSYGQDVSRVLDVVRQSIVFKSVQDLMSCFSIIAADHEVEVIRIRNRYDINYDSNMSGGYRDVNINLRIKSPLAAQLSVEAHVCEVQLLLQSVAELKNGAGHKNYVIWRNLRAE